MRSSHANEDVTLTWPEIANSLPREYQLTLIDGDNKVTRNLRSVSSYTLNTGADATRRIQIVAESARTAARTQILSFDILPGTRVPGRGVATATIHYSLSRAAQQTQISILNQGRVVRQLENGRAADNPNAGSTVWDLKDGHGVALPTGTYLIELRVQDESGQVTRQVQPYSITR